MRRHLLVLLSTLALLTSGAVARDEKTPVKAYPLTVCLVTDNDLDSMGDPVEIVHEGQQVKFCCKPCIKKFQRNPARYLAKLAPAEPAAPTPTPASPASP